ncbi:MAG: hypothetical protein H7331_10600 [Bacteroidia bacterium]|nr:hypothetical protein [Bacteroidia bacterium]
MYVFDNGTDYAHNKLFKIVRNNKINYSNTAVVVIDPIFDGALPFVTG